MRKYLKYLDPLLLVEQSHSATGTYPEPSDAVSKIYRAHFKECDARKAEALILNETTDPLVQLKTLLFRGNFKEAADLIPTVTKLCLDDKARSELCLEQARLALFTGDFKNTVEFSKKALSLDPVPMSKLGLYQVLAAGHFELGEMQSALEALNKADSLRSIFAFCPTSVYSRINRAQISARMQSPKTGKEMLSAVWADLKENEEITKDHMQALLRGEIDLARLSGENHFEEALASYLIAESMGEDLYSTLGLVDCLFSCPENLKDTFSEKLSERLPRFQRAQEIVNQVTSGSPVFTTALTIKTFKEKQTVTSSRDSLFASPDTESIADLNQKVVLNLKKDKILDFDQFPQLGLAMVTLAQGPMTLETFFHRIWGDQKYVPHLHEGLIWNIQQRLKTKLGLEVKISKSVISLPKTLFVGGK